MSEQNTDTTGQSTEADFFKALMAQIMAGSMIPKVQVERAIGPIIGFFLAKVLTKKLGQNVIMLCTEFPIQKPTSDKDRQNNQSTNIDWLMFNQSSNELILLELKTTDTTFKPEQACIYEKLQTSIAEKNSAEFLMVALDNISRESQETGKYQNVLQILEKELPEARNRFANCRKAKVIYLGPEVCRPKNWHEEYKIKKDWDWLCFNDLPETIEHDYASHWPAVRSSLLTIDALTRRIRNGDHLIPEGKNYKGIFSFYQLLKHVLTDQKPIVIGFVNWRKELPNTTMVELQAKSYKWDDAAGGAGKKIDKNWMPGKDFVSHLDQIAA